MFIVAIKTRIAMMMNMTLSSISRARRKLLEAFFHVHSCDRGPAA